MDRRIFFVFVVTLFSLLTEAGGKEFEKVSVAALLPTQFAIGEFEVLLRKRKIEKRLVEGGEAALKSYLKGKALTLVQGPAGHLYVVDGHHLARAVFLLGRRETYGRVVEDWSALSEEKFWKRMAASRYVYPFDENGEAKTVADLPKSLGELRDDPYRSLAWLVRKLGGYEDLTVPFQEFAWANFFRSRVALSLLKANGGDETAELHRAVGEAMTLAGDTAAQSLPGFLGKTFSCKLWLTKLGTLLGDAGRKE